MPGDRFNHVIGFAGLQLPCDNSRPERFIQTLLREWAYHHAFASSARRTAALADQQPIHRRPQQQ